jgi:SAM-dependent methyltransferase
VNEPAPVVQADFDRIALVSGDGWSHNQHYHRYLLGQVPATCRLALDVGCGTGAFSRLLARRSEQVLALDLSPRMIEIARARSLSCPNIDFRVADVIRWSFPERAFDCVTSIATLHHLPMEETLLRMRGALRAGGVLVILDLYKASGWRDILTSMAALPLSLALRVARTGRLREPRRVRQAWAAHGRHDTYPTLAEARRTCSRALPGARVRKHLLWRYSIVWQKPA